MNYSIIEGVIRQSTNNQLRKTTMNEFINAVDKIVTAQLGLSVHDLEDFAFCDYYDETFDPDGYDYQNAVEACAEDFLAEVGNIFVM